MAVMTRNECHRRAKESIHSGHFMVSDIDDPDEVRNNVDVISDPACDDFISVSGAIVDGQPHNSTLVDPSDPVVPQISEWNTESVEEDISGGFDFHSACKVTAKSYKFGSKSSVSISIDASLSRLFQCMTLAYNGKLTSPRWKNFKGTKFKWKEKIRLNNVIWRAWHMQFIVREKPSICQFATLIENEGRSKPVSVIMEGNYWKRKMENVLEEYKLWRKYHKINQSNSSSADGQIIKSKVNWPVSNKVNGKARSSAGPVGMSVDDDALMDFSDPFFSSLTQPFDYPNPREIARGCGLADFIQPGLIQLQPNLDDFMDTFEPFSDLLSLKNFTHDESNLNHLLNSQSVVNQTSNLATPSNTQQSLHPESNMLPPTNNINGNTLLAENNLDTFKFPLSPLSTFQPEQQFQILDSISSHVGNMNNEFSHQNSSIQPLQNMQPPLNASSSNYIINYDNIPHVSDNVQVNKQNMKIDSSAISNLVSPNVEMNSGYAQSQFYDTVSSSTNLPTTSQIRSVFDQSKVMTPQTELICSSAASKQTQNNNHQLPVFTQNASSHTCKPIVPNTSKNIPAQCNVNNPASNILSSLNQANTSMLLPQNTVLAQVLPNGTYVPITSSLNSNPSAVTIVNSLNSSEIKVADNLSQNQSNTASSSVMQSAVIISPIALATMTGMTDFQSRVLAGAANKVFTNSTLQNGSSHGKKLPIPPFSTIVSSAKMCASENSKDNSSRQSFSQNRNTRGKSEEEKAMYKEHRRVVHINAEQKRRFNIKYGFDVIQNLVPSVSQNPHAKISKAQMLNKAADYIRHLKKKKTEMLDEQAMLKKQIESLNDAINTCQSQLPITGAPVSRPNTNVSDQFEEYVRQNTLQNWKFWIFSIIIRPLFEKYDQVVNATSMEEFCSSVLSWLDQYCSLTFFRPAVSNSLRHLSTTTDILLNPSSIESEATKAVSKGFNSR